MLTKDSEELRAKRRRRNKRHYERHAASERARKAKYRSENKEKIRKQNAAYRLKNNAKIAQRTKDRYAAKIKLGIPARQLIFPRRLLFPEVWRAIQKNTNLRNNYKISLEQFEAKKAEQGNRCAMCRISFNEPEVRACADHDHKTGKFRGVLCNHCNLVIGCAREDPVVLRSAAQYIQKGLTLLAESRIYKDDEEADAVSIRAHRHRDVEIRSREGWHYAHGVDTKEVQCRK